VVLGSLRIGGMEIRLDIIHDPALLMVVLMVIGLGLAATLVMYLTVFIIWPYIKRVAAQLTKPREENILLKTSLVSSWIDSVEPKLKRANVVVRADRLAILFIGLAVIGFAFGIFFLKNMMAALLLAISMFVIPDQMLITKIQKRREVMAAQLATVAKMLHTEILITKNPLESLRSIAGTIHDPLKGVLQVAYKKLYFSSEEPDSVFAQMARELDFEYGRLFSHLLLETFVGRDTYEMLDDLSHKCGVYVRISKNNKKILTWLRLTTNILIFLMIPILVLEITFWSTGREFLTQTTLGKLIVAINLLSILINSMVQRMLGNVQY
jgi:Flp pilus assembly protein TadB